MVAFRPKSTACRAYINRSFTADETWLLSSMGLHGSGELEIVFRVTQCYLHKNLLDSKMLEKMSTLFKFPSIRHSSSSCCLCYTHIFVTLFLYKSEQELGLFFRYDLSVPLKCLFPFINSQASPSDYVYSSELKPGENEPFNFKKALTDTSNINLLMTQWHCLKFAAAEIF